MSAPDAEGFLAKPPPRDGADEFLVGVRARLRYTRNVLLGFLGFVSAAIALIFWFARPAHQPLDVTLGLIAATVGTLALLFGASWLFVRQDLSLGRRLLRDGLVERATATGTLRTPNGARLLTVAWTRDGKPAETTFRVPLTDQEADRLLHEPVALLRSADGKLLGVWLGRAGIVTTR